MVHCPLPIVAKMVSASTLWACHPTDTNGVVCFCIQYICDFNINSLHDKGRFNLVEMQWNFIIFPSLKHVTYLRFNILYEWQWAKPHSWQSTNFPKYNYETYFDIYLYPMTQWNVLKCLQCFQITQKSICFIRNLILSNNKTRSLFCA